MGTRRHNNEDNFYLDGLYKSIELADMPSHLCRIANQKAVIAVCDGMGGASYGEYAAWLAVTTIAERYRELCCDHESAKQVENCVQEMNRLICKEGKRRDCEMGSTIVLAILQGEIAHIYNLGDSRAYLFSNGKLTRLTQDHTLGETLRSIGLPATSHIKARQLTQHLGMDDSEFLLEPYHTSVTFHPGDRLLLCSDGLTDMMGEAQIALLLSDGSTPDIQAIRLSRQAERAGGKDNITALVVDCIEK